MCAHTKPMALAMCPTCGGEGEVFHDRWPGNWYEPPCDTYRECEECRGHGSIVGDAEQLDEYDLDEMTPPIEVYAAALSAATNTPNAGEKK